MQAIANANRKAALANAVKTQNAAIGRAKELQQLPKSQRPTATSAAVDAKSGATYYGDSGTISSNINSVLANQMPSISRTGWEIANCAEFNAVNNALNAGSQMQNLVVTTVRVSTLQFFPMCSNCIVSINGVLLVVSG